MTTLCACGQQLVTSNHGNYSVCPHCDHPALHIAATCDLCRLIAIRPTR